MSAKNFFERIAPMPDIGYLDRPEYYVDVPSDWIIAITDVSGSTKAIQEGKYKEVNTCGAAIIAALLNVMDGHDIPFVFGGDGATILLPPAKREAAQNALLQTKNIAKDAYGLSLRIGIIPVSDVLTETSSVKVGRVFMSENFCQPVFFGGGLAKADVLLKDPESSHLYQIADIPNPQADYSGYECRWSKHPAANGNVYSVLVQAIASDVSTHGEIYSTALDGIYEIFGDMQSRHPIAVERMRVATGVKDFTCEVAFRTPGGGLLEVMKLFGWSIGGFLLWKFVKKIWEPYRATVHAATDHEKFDDTLRMTISGSNKQKELLIQYLEEMRRRGKIAYGIHEAPRSLMTCIVYERFGRQVHFVDADNGGYALAAKQMKEMLKQSQS